MTAPDRHADGHTANEPGDTSLEGAIDALRVEVFQLKDLFRRRLMDDKTRHQLALTADEQLRSMQELLHRQTIEEFLRECLLVVDRLQTADGSDAELPRSAGEELLEVFRRRGLDQVDVAAGFDPRVHQVVGTRTAETADEIDAVLEVERAGYTFGDHLLRPAKVTVGVRPRT